MTARTSPPRLGFLYQGNWSGPGLQPLIDLFQRAESLGLHSGWVSQHHFSATPGRLASPLVFLAAAGAVTRKIRLGTATVIAPLEHPVRLAEDAAQLEALGPGRLELGIGTGFGNAFGEDSRTTISAFTGGYALSPETTAANIARLERVLRGEPVAAGSQLRLSPDGSAIADRLWRATAGAETAARAGAAGHGLLLSRRAFNTPLATDVAQASLIDAHAAASGPAARVAASRIIHVTDQPPDEDPVLRRILGNSLAEALEKGELPPDLTLRQQLRHFAIHAGRPDEVARSLLTEARWSSITDLLVMVTDAYSADAAQKNLERIAHEILPQLS